METDGFTVDLAAKKVHRDGRDVRLTPTEWHLLEVLVRNTGRLVSQKQLLQEVWGPSYGTETNYLRVYMAQLRRKLEADPSHPRHFVTEPGMGYRFETVSRAVRLGRRARYASCMSAVPRSEKPEAGKPAGRFRRMLDRLSTSQEDLESEELQEDARGRGLHAHLRLPRPPDSQGDWYLAHGHPAAAGRSARAGGGALRRHGRAGRGLARPPLHRRA